MNQLIQKVYFSSNPLKKSSHYHDCHQIILIKKGQVRFCANSAEHSASSGDVLLFSRYENHSLEVLSAEYERYVLQLDPKARGIGSRVYSLLSNRPQGFCNAIPMGGRQEEMACLFDRLIEERQSPAPLSEEMEQLLINQLLILVFRALPDPSSFEGQHTEILTAIQRRFEQHCGSRYTLESLAKEFSISPSTLSHRFKSQIGSSVMDYLLHCRIATAKNDLVYTALPIGEIVERCGFSDSSNFSRTFKRSTGLSPSEFRKKYKS